MISEKQKQLVEEIGLLHERDGLSPAVARVMSLLLISDKIELTFDEIRETLQLSKSATSNALNIAMKMERVEYITKPGDRKRYFRSRIQLWRDHTKMDFQKKLCWADAFKKILEHRTSETKEFNKAIKDLIDFIEYMGKQMPRLFKEWESKTK